MFSGHETQKAREVVYIEYPKEGLWVPAYVTNKKRIAIFYLCRHRLIQHRDSP
ncbi:DUF502 domain-containing protein [methane-oxidizing endosymbiont of Gigantopelta aegis]|uniref:DUF502 domain-containing protein n=1 Tax=methane-oxidizing endosymbiont of Gigantopelta aegis TaxID=2794938 RepID=UPI00315A3ADB